VLSRGFTDIRTIAYKPEIVGDPAAALERIRLIADACHNLPGAGPGRRRDGRPDPFAWAWQTAGADKREWFTEVFWSVGLDTACLDAIPTRQPSGHARRTLGRIRIGYGKKTALPPNPK